MPNSHPHDRGTDQIFEGITWGKITKVTGAILAVITLAGIAAGVVTATLVTKPELREVKDSLSINHRRYEDRFNSLEARQKTVEAFIGLIPSMARVMCIQSERDKSTTITRAAKLPCDTL